ISCFADTLSDSNMTIFGSFAELIAIGDANSCDTIDKTKIICEILRNIFFTVSPLKV
ncbi:MAG: hypothetical protein HY307_04195, partial [Arcobacter sp.]|nr:hypothetical protein [Arcobacter sp.]